MYSAGDLYCAACARACTALAAGVLVFVLHEAPVCRRWYCLGLRRNTGVRWTARVRGRPLRSLRLWRCDPPLRPRPAETRVRYPLYVFCNGQTALQYCAAAWLSLPLLILPLLCFVRLVLQERAVGFVRGCAAARLGHSVCAAALPTPRYPDLPQNSASESWLMPRRGPGLTVYKRARTRG